MSEPTTRASHYARIIPRSPLLLGDRSGFGNFQQTEDFIPGAAIRGAVAAELLDQCARPDYLHDHASCPDKENCPFWQLLGSDEPHFGNAYPGQFGPVWPLPLTARTCKRYPGFPQADDLERHGVVDHLFADFAYGLVSDPDFPGREQLQSQLGRSWSAAWQPQLRESYDACQVLHHGQKCGQPMTLIEGYYAWNSGQREVRPARPLSISRATHVGINRARSVAQDQLLFTQENISKRDESDAFFARVTVLAGKQALLANALPGAHFVGGGRSRGLGEVEITIQPAPHYPTLSQRLQAFQFHAHKALLSYQQQDKRVQPQLPGQLFSLTLRAPAILSDAARPCRVPTPAMLHLPEDVWLVRAWARMEEVGGWDSAARLPRRSQLATRAGSVFLYFAPHTIPMEALQARLEQLEQDGIGEERERGYGELTVCAAFHTQKDSPGGTT